jgi:pimeloyl-ACP methyl ester carboxylesterase
MQVADTTVGDTMTEIAAHILAEAPARCFGLAGLSMGGAVAMEIMRQAPERVTRLALLDCTPRTDTPERTELRRAQIARVRAGELEALTRDTLAPLYIAPRNMEMPGLVETVVAMARELGPDVFIRQINALLTRRDSVETLRGIAVPALVLCGREDALFAPALHREMQALIRNSRLAIIEDAGHLPTLERPDAVNAELRDWLSGPHG